MITEEYIRHFNLYNNFVVIIKIIEVVYHNQNKFVVIIKANEYNIINCDANI